MTTPAQLAECRAFLEPAQLQPSQTREAVTQDAAQLLNGLAHRLRQRDHAPQPVAHFITRLLFCLFAENIGLLSDQLFINLLAEARRTPADFPALARDLFRAMHLDDDHCLPLEKADLDTLHSATALDWSAIEPAIFGTLFERGLDPDKRSQLGAHYTDADAIRRLIEPVIRDPLLAEWAIVKAEIADRLRKTSAKTRQPATDLWHGFLERLRTFRVLDPACGSGNFLYLALRMLKDLEHQVMLEAEALGLQRGFPAVGPEAVLGIEINAYAAELARLTVWIGEIQWMLGHGYSLNDQPILKPLNAIECRDALLDCDQETTWPKANVIVGNPPFLGGTKLLRELGDDYMATLRRIYAGRVPGGADLVCYWFEKARAQIASGQTQRAGLVATNSIRGGANRKVLKRIRETGTIFHAWSDEPWVNEGAAVRVSLVGFGNSKGPVRLNGQSVLGIYADLTGYAINTESETDLTQAKKLQENNELSFSGTKKGGSFEIKGDIARQWLLIPNPHNRLNSEVLRPWINGRAIVQRSSDLWIIDFGTEKKLIDAALYEAPFQYLQSNVKPQRDKNNRPSRRDRWWLHSEVCTGMRSAISPLTRYIATPRVSKYRIFIWLDHSFLIDDGTYLIARSDDTTFGILHSRFHELWALRTCTSLGATPRYTPTTCFETFPFPIGLTPSIPAADYANNPHAQAIATAARQLDTLRQNWLNPPDWVDHIPEVIPGYPDRLMPKPAHAAMLKQRTLTNLYNQRPAWLIHAHRALDEAVAAAYGWSADLTETGILRRLLALNRERASATLPTAD
ncbi:MAG: hypothetical protein QG599_1569 [Pseudomonadota bacterium]|nr:hypothetical protein [Pseudomonadota bacterium]